MPPLLFVFVDGVGLGPPDPGTNPFAAAATPTLDALAGGSWTDDARAGRSAEGLVLRAIDATLGHPGLPQSATGQTALLTGRDAVAIMDGHYGPWPGPTLRRTLAEGNLFGWAGADGEGREADAPRARLAGAYPPGFFEALGRRRLRLNAPVHAARAAGVPLPDLTAYREGRAVSADLDGAYFASLGAAPRGPAGAAAAGARLAGLAAEAPFTFFDVWTTDRTGHGADLAAGRELVARLDRFLDGLLANRPGPLTVLLTSDHGNLEDLSHRRHTLAPVPLLAVGPHAGAFADAQAITDVAAGVRAVWAGGAV